MARLMYAGGIEDLVTDVAAALGGSRPGRVPEVVTDEVLREIAEDLERLYEGQGEGEDEYEQEDNLEFDNDGSLDAADQQSARLSQKSQSRESADQARYSTVDWHAAWDDTGLDPDWLCEPVLERGRAVALFSPGKTGLARMVHGLGGAQLLRRPHRGPAARPAPGAGRREARHRALPDQVALELRQGAEEVEDQPAARGWWCRWTRSG